MISVSCHRRKEKQLIRGKGNVSNKVTLSLDLYLFLIQFTLASLSFVDNIMGHTGTLVVVKICDKFPTLCLKKKKKKKEKKKV